MRPLKLEIQLDSRFPQKTAPRIFLRDLPEKAETLCNDGRDFLEDIIKQSWNPSIFLIDIVKSLPNFLVFSHTFASIFHLFLRKKS